MGRGGLAGLAGLATVVPEPAPGTALGAGSGATGGSTAFSPPGFESAGLCAGARACGLDLAESTGLPLEDTTCISGLRPVAVEPLPVAGILRAAAALGEGCCDELAAALPLVLAIRGRGAAS